MTRALTAAGWRVDVLAEGVESVGGVKPSMDVEPSVQVFPVSQSWFLRRWRLAWRHRRSASEMPASEEAAAPATEAVDPSTVPVEGVGQRMGLVETFHATFIGLLDFVDGWVWVRRARALADRLVRLAQLEEQAPYNLVIATSPHQLTHCVAAAVARRHGIPYLADYRDPWYFGRGPGKTRLDPLTRRLWRRLERRCLGAATAVVDIAEGAQRAAIEELRQVEPELALLPRFFIANGWEPGPVAPPDAEVFRIVYTGWLWPFMPVPQLLSACGELRRRRGLESDRFRVEMVGVEPHFNGVPLAAIARGAGLADCFSAHGRIPRAEADLVQDRAAVSIAFDSVCAHGLCIPSKLYHCAHRWGDLLPIGRPDGAMAEEAAKIGVETTSPDDREALVARLDASWERWQRGEMTGPVDAEGLFDIRRRGREMVELLDAIRRGDDLRSFRV